MMPTPENIASMVNDADRLVGPPLILATYPSDQRRRLIAEAVFKSLRDDWDGAYTLQPFPVPV